MQCSKIAMLVREIELLAVEEVILVMFMIIVMIYIGEWVNY